MKISRKQFIEDSILVTGGSLLVPGFLTKERGLIITVNGSLDARRMGFTLTHEHILVDFVGANAAAKSRYDADEVFTTALPFVKQIKEKGVATFIDCTPAYLGRDVMILKRLADATGMAVMAATGYYGAANGKFVPSHANAESAQLLAARWISEWRNGIEGTGIKPGFIKTGTDKGPLTAMQQKLVRAAGITHLATGLTIAIHTGDGAAAFKQLEILKEQGVSPAARIWVHAQNEPDRAMHVRAGKLKTWISFDGVNPETLQVNLGHLQNMKTQGMLDRVLVSQDSGWYHVGEPNGGNFKPYTCISDHFIPLLQQNGFTARELDLIFKKNPANAFAVKVRKY